MDRGVGLADANIERGQLMAPGSQCMGLEGHDAIAHHSRGLVGGGSGGQPFQIPTRLVAGVAHSIGARRHRAGQQLLQPLHHRQIRREVAGVELYGVQLPG